MATNKPVWGIDLGQNALKAIRLRAAGDMVEAVDYAYIEHGRILSSQQDAMAREGMISDTMKKFMDNHNLSNEPLVVAVPGQHTLARFVKLPPADKKKVPEIVKYEAQQQIPFDMEEVIWDYQVFGHSPEGTEVGIFAMRREVLREQLRFLSDLNLEPAAVQSAPLALYNALKFDGIVGTDPVAILDIGAQNSDLIISDGESLWTRNIPIGGNHFTEALLKTFKLSFNKAENLKRTAASSKYARQIFQAMRPVFADLVAEIQRSIGFFTGSRRGVKLSKVIAMGNAFQLPGMVKFIQQNLSMEVVRPTSFSKLSASEAPNAPDLLKQLGTFGVAYGLALQGLNKAQITSSLLPPDIAKQIVWRKKTPWFYGAAACLVLSAGVIWGRTMMDSNAIAAVKEGSMGPPGFSPVQEEVNGVKLPRPDPDSFQILQNGPPTQNPLGYANYVVGASQHLSSVEQTLRSANDADAQKVRDISQLKAYQTIWPQILYKIHSALPQDELSRAMAAGPEAFKELIKDPRYSNRSKRKIIVIEKVQSRYSNDVMSLYDDMLHAGGSNVSPGKSPSGGAALSGFVITIEGRTPLPHLEAPTFINDTFRARLAQVGAQTDGAAAKPPAGGNAPADINVYFDKVRLMWCSPMKTAEGNQPTGSRGFSRGPVGFGGGLGGGFGGGSFDSEFDPYKDPVTGESRENDSVFEIRLVAVVGNKPAQQAPVDEFGENYP